ncbi:MAG: homoserine dehydrogenase [Deltaproteobacteria bacterium]|nr:homoserine dehydrogenase [Deltaproteobacteria bacterium]
MKTIKVGVLGFGTVGSGVVRLLLEKREMLSRRLGTDLVLARIADQDLERPRPVTVPRELLTPRAQDILDDPEIDIVVELIGGLDPARDYMLTAIDRGKHVVTANKALLAHHGNELLAAATAKGVEIAFEAAVCGGIPIIVALRQGLAANRIQELFGILNGTCNFILTQMSQHGMSYAQALAEAQAAGYAEADPTLDVEGIDTAHKLTILMSLAYGARLDLEAIAVEGISRLDPLDLQFAREFGYRLKLLAITRDDGHRVEARVHPTLVPKGHMLSQVNGAMNAVYLTGDAAGPILLYGQGAGMMPTASAVVSDILDLARNLTHGAAGRVPPLGCRLALESTRLIKPMNDLVTNYYFRFAALDRPGVLSQVSGILGKYAISIAAVIQKGRVQGEAGTVPIVMITHEAREADALQALKEIDRLTVVSPPAIFYRIEDPHLHAAQI